MARRGKCYGGHHYHQLRVCASEAVTAVWSAVVAEVRSSGFKLPLDAIITQSLGRGMRADLGPRNDVWVNGQNVGHSNSGKK